MRILLVILLCINFLYSEEKDNNIVKTSELELFLFKVGFQSLLKDFDYTKDRSIENKSEIDSLNKKVRLIMDEIYKEKRIIKTESSINMISNIKNQDLANLKKEIDILKKQMKILLINKTKKVESKTIKIKKDSMFAKINKDEVNLRKEASNSSQIVGVLKKGDIIEIDFCNSYAWCKVKNKESFIAKFLLYFETN